MFAKYWIALSLCTCALWNWWEDLYALSWARAALEGFCRGGLAACDLPRFQPGPKQAFPRGSRGCKPERGG